MRRPRLRRLAPSRDLVTTFLELFGIACLAVFAYHLWPHAAYLVVGVASILLAWTNRR